MVVEEVMTKNPVTVDATTTVGEAMRALLDLDVRHLPVMDAGELVGIVSDRDLRSLSLPVLAEADALGEASKYLGAAVTSVMASNVLSVDPESELSEAVDLMLEHRVGAIPVVTPGSRQLVGIVSYVDVLRSARDAL